MKPYPDMRSTEVIIDGELYAHIAGALAGYNMMIRMNYTDGQFQDTINENNYLRQRLSAAATGGSND